MYARKIQWLARLLGVVMILALVAASIPQPAQADPAAVRCIATYTVKQGDTLAKIARLYQIKASTLADANDLDEDDDLDKGQELCIPKGATLPDEDKNTSGNNKTNKGVWTVFASGDKLVIETSGYTKAEKFFVRVGEGYRTNGQKRVGTLRALKNEKNKQTFEIPDSLHGVNTLTVCLKNLRTDALQCKTVTRR